MSIIFNEETKIFYLNGKNITYSFLINEDGFPEHLYFGEKIGFDDIRYTRGIGRKSFEAKPQNNKYYNDLLSPEISFFGLGDFKEPTFQVKNKTGDRLCELKYSGYEILDSKPKISNMPSLRGNETLIVHLSDEFTNFAADLYYSVYEDLNIIARRIVYKNNSDNPVFLERAFSFSQSLPSGNYDFISLFGGWGTERHIERVPLHHGISSIDSKRTSSSATLNPFIAIAENDATEISGNVYGFSLVYSSSYILKAEKYSTGEIIVTGGINDFDFTWKLESEEIFETPEIVIAYSGEGIGGMSRAFHNAYRGYLINNKFVSKPRPIVINNWEATYFDFNNDKLKKIVDCAENTGIDTFVLDDGWFGKRNNEKCSLGDWNVNTDKLEGGLKTIIDYTHSKGLKFGLWFEPEMISPDSDLFRAHPEYAISVPGRENSMARYQCVLDLTKSEVRDFIVNSVNKIIKENGIDYVKWDFNRNITESFSLGRESDRQSEFAHRYALGLYDIFERIVYENKNVFFEGCSGGGARFDPAILYYFPQIWTSDCSDAEERTIIQYGTSMVYPLSSISCHVSQIPNHQCFRTTEFKTRTNIAQLGATGYELDLSELSSDEISELKENIKDYRNNEDLILKGDLFRIDNPNTSEFFSEMVVSKDKNKAILTTYRRLLRPNAEVKRIKMQGLDKNKKYFVSELNGTFSGSTLMNVGIQLKDLFPRYDFSSFKFHIKAV